MSVHLDSPVMNHSAIHQSDLSSEPPSPLLSLPVNLWGVVFSQLKLQDIARCILSSKKFSWLNTPQTFFNPFLLTPYKKEMFYTPCLNDVKDQHVQRSIQLPHDLDCMIAMINEKEIISDILAQEIEDNYFHTIYPYHLKKLKEYLQKSGIAGYFLPQIASDFADAYGDSYTMGFISTVMKACRLEKIKEICHILEKPSIPWTVEVKLAIAGLKQKCQSEEDAQHLRMCYDNVRLNYRISPHRLTHISENEVLPPFDEL